MYTRIYVIMHNHIYANLCLLLCVLTSCNRNDVTSWRSLVIVFNKEKEMLFTCEKAHMLNIFYFHFSNSSIFQYQIRTEIITVSFYLKKYVTDEYLFQELAVYTSMLDVMYGNHWSVKLTI